MANKKPIVMSSLGKLQQIQTGQTIASSNILFAGNINSTGQITARSFKSTGDLFNASSLGYIGFQRLLSNSSLIRLFSSVGHIYSRRFASTNNVFSMTSVGTIQGHIFRTSGTKFYVFGEDDATNPARVRARSFASTGTSPLIILSSNGSIKGRSYQSTASRFTASSLGQIKANRIQSTAATPFWKISSLGVVQGRSFNSTASLFSGSSLGVIRGSSIKISGLSTGKVLYSSSKVIQSSTVTKAELGYLGGVTSGIQSQINGKEPTQTKGSISEVTSSVLTINNGSNATVGPNTTIQVKQANISQSGYLGQTDLAAMRSFALYQTVESLKALLTTNLTTIIAFSETGATTTLYDKYGSNNITLSGNASTLDPEAYGLASYLNFNASGDFWSMADSTSLTFTDGSHDKPWTFIVLTNPNSVTSGYIIAKYLTSNLEYIGLGFASSKLYTWAYDQTNLKYRGRLYNTALTGDVGSWHVYQSSYDGSEATTGFKIYRDGARIDDTDFTSGGTYTCMRNLGAEVSNYGGTTASKTNVYSGKISLLIICNTDQSGNALNINNILSPLIATYK